MRYDQVGFSAVTVNLINGSATGTYDDDAFQQQLINTENVILTQYGGMAMRISSE